MFLSQSHPFPPHTCKRIVGVEPQSIVSQAREQLGFHLASGGIVHTLHKDEGGKELQTLARDSEHEHLNGLFPTLP